MSGGPATDLLFNYFFQLGAKDEEDKKKEEERERRWRQAVDEYDHRQSSERDQYTLPSTPPPPELSVIGDLTGTSSSQVDPDNAVAVTAPTSEASPEGNESADVSFITPPDTSEVTITVQDTGTGPDTQFGATPDVPVTIGIGWQSPSDAVTDVGSVGDQTPQAGASVPTVQYTANDTEIDSTRKPHALALPSKELPPSKARRLLIPTLGALVIIGAIVVGIVLGTRGASTPTAKSSTTGLHGQAPASATPASPLGAPSATPSAGSTLVTIPFNELSFTGNIPSCQGITLHVGVTILGIASGTPVVVDLNGPGVPSSFTFQANPGKEFQQAFPTEGPGTWSDDIVSIGGQPPPANVYGAHESTTYQC